MKEIEELQIASEELRGMVSELNELAKVLEGKGCSIKFQVDKPYNVINFVLIEKKYKL